MTGTSHPANSGFPWKRCQHQVRLTRAMSEARNSGQARPLLVFAGPSVAGLAPLSDAIAWRAPAGCGDLLEPACFSARAVLLIDGVFEAHRAVWHKEILQLLASGVPVYGAASMGALRAAELAAFGMQGLGLISRWYRRRRCTDDGDVAVLHGPAELGYAPMTEALVNVMASAAAAKAANAIPKATAQKAVKLARQLYYKRRTAAALQETWRQALGADAALALARHRTDQKALDAAQAVALLSQAARPPAPPAQPKPPLTGYFKALLEARYPAGL
jgi:hypothetical protein